MKKFTVLFIALVCCFVLFSCDKSEEKTISNEDFEFTYNDTGLTVSKYLSGDAEAIIPSEYKGNRVTEIGNGAFKGYYDVSKISIPNGITKIGDSAFELCIGIKSIELPGTLTYIGFGAFASCRGLTEIEIPASVETIQYGAFKGCKQLEYIDVDENNGIFFSDDGVLYSKNGDDYYLVGYPAGKEDKKYTVIDNTTTVNMYSFSNTQYLKEVILPDCIKTLAEYSFYQSSVDTITLTDNIEILGTNCFAESKLSTITLNDGLKEIGTSCFNWCTQLEEIIIPSSVNEIGTSAFFHCSGLKKVTFSGTKPDDEKLQKIFEECSEELIIE